MLQDRCVIPVHRVKVAFVCYSYLNEKNLNRQVMSTEDKNGYLQLRPLIFKELNANAGVPSCINVFQQQDCDQYFRNWDLFLI